MPRCGCASDRCSCYIEQGNNVQVSGSGTQQNPYVISAEPPTIEITPGTGGAMTGEIKMWPGSTVPDGYLLCNGQAISRAVYSTLFAILGTTAGAGDGSTTFNLPNFVDRVPIGVSGTKARNTRGGLMSRILDLVNLPAHTHTIDHGHTTDSSGAHDHELGRVDTNGSQSSSIPRGGSAPTLTSRLAIAADGAHTHTVSDHAGNSGSSGSGTALDTTPAHSAVNFIIKT